MKNLLVILVIVFFVSVAHAESIKCPSGRIVSVGDTRMEVLSKCGQPDDIEYERHGKIPVKFFYNAGPNSFIVVISFSLGKVQSVESGNYGFTK